MRKSLSNLREILKLHSPNPEDKTYLFCFVIHDWLSHLSQQDPLLPEYGFSVWEVIQETITKTEVDKRTKHWLEKVHDSGPTIHTLLYRHYLSQRMLDEEIFPIVHYTPLYVMMGSMMYSKVEFTQLEEYSSWMTLETSDHLINRLRKYRPRIAKMIGKLSNRDDITPWALQRDHGLLSSHCLLYILYLIRVILIFTDTVSPDTNRKVIIHQLTLTLDQLKGVLFSVKTQRIGIDV